MPDASAIPTAAVPTSTAVAHCLLDADGEVLAAEQPDRPFYAASTIKLHVLAAALHAVGTGDLAFEQEHRSRRSFRGADGAEFTLGGDHLDPTHPADGAPITVRELMVRMIDRSSNEATDHLVQLLGAGDPQAGLEAVGAQIQRLGLQGTRVGRLIGDASALAAGATNETTAADLARTMRALVSPGSEASAQGRDLARQALRAQRIRIIADALRPGVDAGSKSGWVEGYRHDVAFIGDPDGAEVRHLAVLTAGLEQQRADEHIRGLTAQLLPAASRA